MSEQGRSTHLQDVRAAFAFLTLLPAGTVSTGRPGRAFAWFPLVGLVIGALLAAAALLPAAPLLHAFLILALWVGVTGGLHLDGWADSCDALWAALPPERRLEILKDPKAGSWAVVGLVLLLLGKFAALVALAPSPLLLVVAPVAGRWAMVLAARAFPYARSGGLGGWMREGLGRRELIVATLTALGVFGLLAMGDWRALWGIGAALAAAYGFGRWAAARLGGGLTGDVYGAACELAELIALAGMALLA